jgi:hypothetical protein
MADEGSRRLAEHARECRECAEVPPDVAAVADALRAYLVALDVAALSHGALLVLRPELARLASNWFWQRLARVTLAAVLPLPLIVAADGYLLALFYRWAAGFMPHVVAVYLVLSYAALQVLLFAATYAAIPLVLARQAWNRSAGLAEALP